MKRKVPESDRGTSSSEDSLSEHSKSVIGKRLVALGSKAVDGGISALKSRCAFVRFVAMSENEINETLELVRAQRFSESLFCVSELEDDIFDSSVDVIICECLCEPPYVPLMVSEAFRDFTNISEIVVIISDEDCREFRQSIYSYHQMSDLLEVVKSGVGSPLVLRRRPVAPLKRRRMAIAPGSGGYDDAVMASLSATSLDPTIDEPTSD